MVSASQITKFVIKAGYLYRPDNPGRRYEINQLITNIPTCSKLLIGVINSGESDKSLERLDLDFHTHAEAIIQISDLEKLPIPIEGLAQKFEAFLKKIAYLKYGDTDLWHGNETSAGITGTTFKNLCEGIIENKYNVDRSIPCLSIPEPLVNYRGTTRSLLDFTREKLRNAVHYAPEINRKDLIPYSEIVISIYLLTIQDNFEFLSKKYLPHYNYKTKLLDRFKEWDKLYVNIDSEYKAVEEILDFSPELFESNFLDQDDSNLPRTGTIADIFATVKRLTIIGNAGQGKTTSLKFLGYQLVCNSDILPIYYQLKDYDANINLLTQLADEVGLTDGDLVDIANSGNLTFLLDGINEVIKVQDRNSLFKQLTGLLKKFPNVPIAITSRPKDYNIELDLPVFELLPLANSRINELLTKYYSDKGGKLYSILVKVPKLLELCRNPLLLKMFGTIYIKDDIDIPNNKGLLIKGFIHNILNREKAKNYLISPEKLNIYLISLGYHTRVNQLVSFNINQVIDAINRVAMEIDPICDRMTIIDTIIDLNLITKSLNKFSFSHELFQEYFAAEGLLIYPSTEVLQELTNEQHWEYPLIMYSGLTKNRFEFITNLSNHHPLLATECALTSILDESDLRNHLVEINFEQSKNIDNSKIASEALLSLIKLGRSNIVMEAIRFNLKNIGKKAFNNYRDICTEIIKKVDIDFLPTTIDLLLSIDDSFIKMILRGIDYRTENELKSIQPQLEPIVDKINFHKLSHDYMSRLLRLIPDENVTQLRRLFDKLLLKDETKIDPILKNFIEKNSQLSLELIKIALKSKNIRFQADGIHHALKSHLEDYLSEELKISDIYQNMIYRSILTNLDYDWKSYLDGINWIYNDYKKKQKLKELQESINSWIECKVVNVSSKGYISLSIPEHSFVARIYDQEIIDRKQFSKPGQKVILRLTYVNPTRRIILFSQKEKSNINYIKEINKYSQFHRGEIVRCEIFRIVPNYLKVQIEGSIKGSIHISRIDDEFKNDLQSRFKVGQWLFAEIIGIDYLYGPQLSLKKNLEKKQLDQVETDLATKLWDALMKNNGT